MRLRDLQWHWERFGRTDPLWAILTNPAKRNHRWDPAEFFAIGRESVAFAMSAVLRLAPDAPRGRALDFGCGVGRLTQALAEYYAHVTGVDIAPSMLEKAREFNRYGERCDYRLNESADLAQFPDGAFDLVCSSIVLQHVHPRFSRRYLAEFMRVLAPGGIVYVQLPCTAGTSPWVRLREYVYVNVYRRCLHWGAPRMEIHGMPRQEVTAILEKGGGAILAIMDDDGPGRWWSSYCYCARKTPA